MEYTKLGNTDIEVSKLCVGCMSFGKAGTMHDWTLDEKQTDEMVAHALDLGINFFDTANGYSAGTSEEYLGKALKNHTTRDKVVMHRKYILMKEDFPKELSSGKSESLRGRTDRVAVGKYDRTEDADMKIVTHVHELAEKYQCKMSQIAIAWQWAKGVTSPIIGATKMQYLDDAAGALNVRLTAEGIAYLEECYVPHPIVGAIDKNPAQGVMLLDEKK